MKNLKRVLWISNAPFTPTGYGNQTQLITAILPKYGHKMAVACNYGLAGKTMEVNGVTWYPEEQGVGRAKDGGVKWANELFDPDIIVSLYDPWIFQWPYDENIKAPWVAWTPIDTKPASKNTVKILKEKAAGVVAYSEFGQKTLKDYHEIDADFIPHGVVTNTFVPGDPAAGRAMMNIPEDIFLVSMIANNQGLPNRKAIYESMVAFRSFHARHPDSAIYLHMITGESRYGVDIPSVLVQLDFPDGSVYCVDQKSYGAGLQTTQHMVLIYQSTDVLLNPALGEGFGIPIMEAQSCGTPVIANDWTAMTELVERAGGWLVKGQPFRHAHQSDFSMPLISSIEQGLEAAYYSWKTGKQWEERVMAARTLALSYDFQNVVAPMWHQYLINEEWTK